MRNETADAAAAEQLRKETADAAAAQALLDAEIAEKLRNETADAAVAEQLRKETADATAAQALWAPQKAVWAGRVRIFFLWNLEEVSLICHKFAHNYIKI